MLAESPLSTFIFNIFFALLPILAWIYFFQKKQPEKRLNVIFAFLGGMISVLPIKLYERYWDISIYTLSHINIFRHLADLAHMPSLPQFLAYVTVSILVAFGLFIFVGIIMFLLEVLSGDNSAKVYAQKTRKIFESPFFFISIGVIIGLVAYFSSFSLHQKIWFFIIVGMLEEFVKHLFLRFTDEEKVHSIDDAVEYSILVALGFAFVENIFYFQNIFSGGTLSLQEYGLFMVLRSGISVAAHVIFSAIFGYFYGLAKFSDVIYAEEKKLNQHPIIGFFHKVLHLKGSTLYHEEKMMEGLLLAIVLHAIFNALLEFGLIHFVVPFTLICFFIVLHLFHRWDFRVEKLQVIGQVRRNFRSQIENIP
jgi:RsiW-degrading membrane proteinase PrsW (M82 family)